MEKKRTVSFSMTEKQYLRFKEDAENRGQTVAQYFKTAAFSFLHKYEYKHKSGPTSTDMESG